MMRLKNIIHYVAGMTLLLACAPTKEAGSHFPIPEHFLQGVGDSSTVSSIPWHDFFQNKELVGYIDAAVAQNFDVLYALKNVEMAEQELRQARINWLPDLGISANGSPNAYSVPLQFSWEIDIWGKIRKAKQAARSAYLRSTEVQRAVQSAVVANVATTYYNMLLLKKQTELVTESIALNDSVLSMLTVQHALGNADRPAVQQAEAQHQSALLTRLQLENELKIQEHALALLTGKTSLAKQPLCSGFSNGYYSQKELLKAGVPADLMQNRPDVKASEFALQEANAKVGIARRNFYPTLTIQAQGGLRETDISELFSVNKVLFGVIDGALYQPLFNRGKLKKEYAQAKLAKEQSEIEFRRSFTVACLEVSNALIQTESLNRQQLEAAKRNELLVEVLRGSRLLFANGNLSYIEVLTIQRDLLQSQLEEVAIVCKQLQSETELYRALGGGWRMTQ